MARILSTAPHKLHEFRFAESCLVPPGRISSRVPMSRWRSRPRDIGCRFAALCVRPVLILSHEVFNARSGTGIAVAVTSQAQRAGFPL